MNENIKKDHKLEIINRNRLCITGVTDVDNFNEEEIYAKTDYGRISIKGSNLNIEVLDVECGNLNVTGSVVSITYSNAVNNGSMLKRMFSLK